MILSKRSLELENESAFSVLNSVNKLKEQGHSIINLSIGQPDFDPPQHIIEAGLRSLKYGPYGYTHPKGIIELREAISKENYKLHNQYVNPDNIVVSPGGKTIIYISILMTAEIGTEVIIHDPSFPIYSSVIKYAGAIPISVNLKENNSFSLNAQDILNKINDRTRLIILNFPNNPTGGVYYKNELDLLINGLEKHPKISILSDEIYSKFVFNKKKFISLIEYKEIKDRLIVINGLSKSFAMTGFRIGWGIFPDKMIEIAEKYATNIYSCVNTVAQYSAIKAINNDQNFIYKMLQSFNKRSKLLTKGLNKVKGFSCIKPNGSFYCFPNISKTKMSSLDLQNRLLNEAGIATIAGSSFGKCGEGFLRVSCSESENNLQMAINKLKDWANYNMPSI